MYALQVPLRVMLTAYGFVQFAVRVLWLGRWKMPRILSQEGTSGRPLALESAHHQVRRYLAVLRRLDLVMLETSGTPSHAPVIVVANHPSLLDFIVFLRDFPNAVCLYKSESLRNPVLSPFVQLAGYIEGMDGSASTARRVIGTAAQRLAEGHHVIIFPEGTRSPGAVDLHKFKTTAFHSAIKSDTAVQPVAIYCDPLFLGKHQSWLDFCRNQNKMHIRYLPVIEIDSLPADQRNAAGFASAAQARIQESLNELAQDSRQNALA